MSNQQQATFAAPTAEKRRVPTQRERFLIEMERAVPWSKLRALVGPVYADPKSRRVRPLELDRMLRIYFLQRWFRLTDAAVREELYDSAAMRSFACIGLGPDSAPEEPAIRRFRGLLQEFGLAEMIGLAADRHLRALGFAVAPGAIVDARLIRISSAHAQVPFARIIDTAGMTAA
jgi:transposase, IS5 family